MPDIWHLLLALLFSAMILHTICCVLSPCFATVATHSGFNTAKKLLTHFVLENFKLSYSLKSTDCLSLGQPLVWFILFDRCTNKFPTKMK